MTPFVSLLLTGLTVLFLSYIFWPKRGFLWKWQRGTQSTMRILIEDALKHLYDQEYKGLKCTLQSICGTLAISGDKAAKLMVRLESMGLVKSKDEGFLLTKNGRSYALRMVRIHRLWEKYLADETGLAETEWHQKAEILEHNMTDDETDALAEYVGNPSYDPDGDPIPTSTGSIPPKKGHALTDLEEGRVARVIHIEDEPGAIYAQIIAQGLHPGVQIQMLEKTPERIQFIADGEENVLAPVVAANVTVVSLPKEQKMEGPFDSLADLQMNEKCEVIGISRACRGQQRRRLMDLGIIPGTVIVTEMSSLGGNPTAYNIRGATIALRKQQAEMIHVKHIKEVE